MINIYEIICWTTGLRYIGSTSLSLRERLRDHKNRANTRNITSKYVLNHNNYEIYLLEKCNLENRKNREDYYIRHTDCVNYRGEIKNKKEIGKKYSDSEKGKKKASEWRKLNKDKLKIQKDKYKLGDVYKAYRTLRVICSCGIEILNCNMRQHEKSKKHQNYLISINKDAVPNP
jgi:hypothetical protein